MIKIGKNISDFSVYSCQPKTKKELVEIIENRISNDGPNCDLNDIDTSLITDMSWLFEESEFNGDISKWNTSNVADMSYMFGYSNFNGDISKWNVSKVKNMSYMFFYSNFDGDISCWDVSKVNQMEYLFAKSKFNQNVSKWKINNKCCVTDMFYFCSIKDEFKPKSLQK